MNSDKIKEIELKMLKELISISNKHQIDVFLAYGSALGARRESGFIEWDTDIDIVVLYEDYKILCKVLETELSDEFTVSTYSNSKEYDSLKARIHIKHKSHELIHIDLFPLAGISNRKIVQKIQVKFSHFLYRCFYYKKYDNKDAHKNNSIKLYLSYGLKLVMAFVSANFLIMLFESINRRYSTSESKYLHNTCGSYGDREVVPRSYYGKGSTFLFEDVKVKLPDKIHEYLTHFYGEDYMIPKKINYLSDI